ncbi:MAG TPA: hopanoid biosynthesis-associated protein HpnK [Gammaproteobacteria bacterium]|nr:hopanoid biosynthesis-associated protein HpnK [Gammaproteobacteria bacterium]
MNGHRRWLIVTADDFGSSAEVNEAVETAHLHGLLGAASLMVGAPAAADAVRRLAGLPALRVGLHVVLVDGQCVLPARQVDALVDRSGRFPARMIAYSIRLFFSPRMRRQARAEIRAQFERFRAWGLELDHVNAHKHFHLHPTVMGMILQVGREFGLKAVRLPNEPPAGAGQGGVRARAGRLAWRVFISPWMALLRWRVRRAGVCFNDYVFGLSCSGAMNEAIVLTQLAALPSGISEMYFHPGVPGSGGGELRALTSRRVREMLDERGIRLTSFTELAAWQTGATRSATQG